MVITPLWTPQQLRTQARLDEADSSLDTQLELYARAAYRAIESHTGRTLYPPDQPLPADAPENALQANEDITLAILLMVAHWFDNNAAVAEGQSAEIPLGYAFLVDPHRFYSF